MKWKKNRNVPFLNQRHDSFFQVRYSESIEELQATRDSVTKEISYLRSNDSKSENDGSLKQQLNSLLYLKKNVDARIHRYYYLSQK